LHALLNQTLQQLQTEPDVAAPVAALIGEMGEWRRQSEPREWKEWARKGFRRHPLYPVLLEDPFVRHSAVRPRGYPGDAELLDYIYGADNILPKVDGASDLGRRLYAFDRNTPAPVAVRNRLMLAAAEIDCLAATGMRPHILNIACGHLREAPMLRSLAEGTLGRFVGLDQDPLSLDLVDREWSHAGVEARQCDARMLMRHGLETLGKFDFIYCLGLYDYLSEPAARRLLTTCVDMLNPGGRVWIANFMDDTWTNAYMEAMMDWWLIYRSEDRLGALADRIPQAKVASRRTFVEPERNVAFLEVVRA
jgi:extracellular factor (EF) 3-hydroxypalmitic acid methyl ester biosynthesis protein